MNKSLEEFESEVLFLIGEHTRRKDLTLDSLINGKPIRADGDDATELLVFLQERTKINFVIDDTRYFSSEAALYDLWQRLTGKWPRTTEPLSIRALARIIHEQAPR